MGRVNFVVLLVVLLLIFMFVFTPLATKHYQGKAAITDMCIKTDLFTIGDKGGINRIYNCKDVDLNE